MLKYQAGSENNSFEVGFFDEILSSKAKMLFLLEDRFAKLFGRTRLRAELKNCRLYVIRKEKVMFFPFLHDINCELMQGGMVIYFGRGKSTDHSVY